MFPWSKRRKLQDLLASLDPGGLTMGDGPLEANAAIMVVRLAMPAEALAGDGVNAWELYNAYYRAVCPVLSAAGGLIDCVWGPHVATSFGAFPTSVSPREAVDCARSCLNALRAADPPTAVGVAFGRCVSGEYGDGSRCFWQPSGGPVVRALALCNAAAPGSVRVDAAVKSVLDADKPGAYSFTPSDGPFPAYILEL